MTRVRKIETVVCGRCGGTGKHSFNMMHGDRCYGCGGSGQKLTKRGKAASEYLETLRSKPIKELAVGDVVRQDWFFALSIHRVWATITKLEPTKNGLIMVEVVWRNEPQNSFENPDKLYRLAQTTAQKIETLRQALDYQDTLSKAGKPLKRRTKLAA